MKRKFTYVPRKLEARTQYNRYSIIALWYLVRVRTASGELQNQKLVKQ